MLSANLVYGLLQKERVSLIEEKVAEVELFSFT